MDKEEYRKLWEKVISSEQLESPEIEATYSTFSGQQTLSQQSEPTETFSDSKTIDNNVDTFSDLQTLGTDKDKPVKEFTISETLSGQETIAPQDSDAKAKTDKESNLQNFSLPIISHCTEGKEIAKGGMGVIQEVHQESLDRDVVAKKVKSDAEQLDKTRFIQESLITAFLEHPNIVPIHELAKSKNGEAMLVMKHVKGHTWKQLLHPKDNSDKEALKKYTLENTGKKENELIEQDYLKFHINVLIKVCDAIAFAHEQGIVHNDLKPANIMVGNYGEVVVMDWGIAVNINEDNFKQHTLHLHKSEIFSPMGTPGYMPVELAIGDGKAISAATDIYLLGAILYEIVNDKPPHKGSTVWMVLLSAQKGDIPRTEVDASLQELQDVYTKALNKNPQDRYTKVIDFQRALREYLEHLSSMDLSRKACEILNNSALKTNYQKISIALDQVISQFDNALELWKTNENAKKGRYKAYRIYTERALEAGELATADAKVLKLEDSDKDIWLPKINTAKEEKIKNDQKAIRNRQLLKVATVAIIIILSIATLWINSARKAAEKARDDAKKAEAQEKDAKEQTQKELWKVLALVSEDIPKQKEAITKVLAMEKEGAETIFKLLKIINESKDSHQEIILSNIGLKKLAPIFLQAFQHEDYSVRWGASKVAARLDLTTEENRKLVEILSSVIKLLSKQLSSGFHKIEPVLATLKQMGYPQGKAALPTIIVCFKERKLHGTEETIAAIAKAEELISFFKNADTQVKELIVEVLTNHKTLLETTSALIKGLQSQNNRVRLYTASTAERIMSRINSLQDKDIELDMEIPIDIKCLDLIPQLVKTLNDNDDNVRKKVVEVLGRTRNDYKPYAKELQRKAFTKIFNDYVIPGLIKALKDNNNEVRKIAVESLGDMKRSSKKALPALRDLLLKEKEAKIKKEIKTAIKKIKFGQ